MHNFNIKNYEDIDSSIEPSKSKLKSKEIMKSPVKQLKSEQNELYNQVHQLGVDAERERINNWLKMGLSKDKMLKKLYSDEVVSEADLFYKNVSSKIK